MTPRRTTKYANTKAMTRFLANSPSISPTGGLMSTRAAGFIPRASIYALLNNKGLYHSAPTPNAVTAATRTAQWFIFSIDLRGRLRRVLHDGPHFNGAQGRARGWNAFRDGDGCVQILCLDQVVAPELFASFRKRPVSHESFPIAYPDAGCRRCRVQLSTGHVLTAGFDLFVELHVSIHCLLPFGLAELGPALLVVVNEQHVFHVSLHFLIEQ